MLRVILSVVFGFCLLFVTPQARSEPIAPTDSWLSGIALAFNHPDNGMVTIYLSRGNWYLMRSNSSRTGQPMGEGGKWSFNGRGNLCIETAIQHPTFADCGILKMDRDGSVEWEHPFFDGISGRWHRQHDP
jgi:hypothetical protein